MPDMLDIPLAIEQAGGNPELAKELFTMLLNELPDHRDKLKQASRNNDEQALWDHTHKIYGATSYCGVPTLRSAARQLEEAIKEQADDLSCKVEGVVRAIDELVETGSAHLAQAWM